MKRLSLWHAEFLFSHSACESGGPTSLIGCQMFDFTGSIKAEPGIHVSPNSKQHK
jgi:hypothetical protein